MHKLSTKCLSIFTAAMTCVAPALASSVTTTTVFSPGNLLLSRSVYSAPATAITVGETLPPVCGASATCTGKATNDATYPDVFFNDLVDGSFGITSPIFLDQITTNGTLVSTFTVPTSTVVTSFSSKSELALNLSSDGNYVTFMGYAAPLNALDVSNSNTPGILIPLIRSAAPTHVKSSKSMRTAMSTPLILTPIAVTTVAPQPSLMATTIWLAIPTMVPEHRPM